MHTNTTRSNPRNSPPPEEAEYYRPVVLTDRSRRCAKCRTYSDGGFCLDCGRDIRTDSDRKRDSIAIVMLIVGSLVLIPIFVFAMCR